MGATLYRTARYVRCVRPRCSSKPGVEELLLVQITTQQLRWKGGGGGLGEAHLRSRVSQALQPFRELLHGCPAPGQLVAAEPPRRGGQLLRSRRGEGVEGRRGGWRGGHAPRRQAEVGWHAKVRVHLKQVRQWAGLYW